MYAVSISAVAKSRCGFEVEAENEAQARIVALNVVKDFESEEFEFDDPTDFEVTNVELIKENETPEEKVVRVLNREGVNVTVDKLRELLEQSKAEGKTP
jgi:hypothetical protein